MRSEEWLCRPAADSFLFLLFEYLKYTKYTDTKNKAPPWAAQPFLTPHSSFLIPHSSFLILRFPGQRIESIPPYDNRTFYKFRLSLLSDFRPPESATGIVVDRVQVFVGAGHIRHAGPDNEWDAGGYVGAPYSHARACIKLAKSIAKAAGINEPVFDHYHRRDYVQNAGPAGHRAGPEYVRDPFQIPRGPVHFHDFACGQPCEYGCIRYCRAPFTPDMGGRWKAGKYPHRACAGFPPYQIVMVLAVFVFSRRILPDFRQGAFRDGSVQDCHPASIEYRMAFAGQYGIFA